MPKTPTASEARQVRRHNPLTEDLAPTEFKHKSPKRKRGRKDEEDEDNFVDAKASRRILQIGQELAEEDEQGQKDQNRGAASSNAFSFQLREDNVEVEAEGEAGEFEDEEAWGDEEEEEVEEVEIDPQDLDVFNRFNPSFDDPILRPGEDAPELGGSTNLADLILAKIAAHEAEQGGIKAGMEPEEEPGEVDIPPKVVEVYSKYAPHTLVLEN